MAESIKAHVLHAVADLNEEELRQVAEYISFVRFRQRGLLPKPDDEQLAALYAEFADEDRLLAEAGMDEYHDRLRVEDAH
ncbi:MAG TPA: hypothetical protein VEG34_14905 [Thermoanaerobaculia bacterium]|nr:hypothetical protein [Thermoanaerobaculia bacterium]